MFLCSLYTLLADWLGSRLKTFYRVLILWKIIEEDEWEIYVQSPYKNRAVTLLQKSDKCVTLPTLNTI